MIIPPSQLKQLSESLSHLKVTTSPQYHFQHHFLLKVIICAFLVVKIHLKRAVLAKTGSRLVTFR